MTASEQVSSRARVPGLALPGWSKVGKSAASEVASSSTRGSGWAPSGPVSPVGAPSQPELPGAP